VAESLGNDGRGGGGQPGVGRKPHDPHRIRPRYWLILGLLIALHTRLNVTLCPFGQAVYGGATLYAVYYAWMGVYMSQPTLLAVWAVLGHQRLALRLPWSLLLVALVVYSSVLGAISNSGRVATVDMVGTTAFGIFLLYLLLQAPLWLARSVFRWRVEPTCSGRQGPRLNETQFGITDLLAWTGGLAGVLAVGHYVLPAEGWRGPTTRWAEILAGSAIASSMIAVISIPAIACIWVALANHRARRLGIWVAMCAAGVTLIAVVGITLAVGIPFQEATFPLVVVQVSLCVSTLMSLSIVRCCGFRLVRCPARYTAAA
jgi:hypothetical protein